MSHPSLASLVLTPPYSGEREAYALGAALSPDGGRLAVLYSLRNQPHKDEQRLRLWRLADRSFQSIPLDAPMEDLAWPRPELVVMGTFGGLWAQPTDGTPGRALPLKVHDAIRALCALPGGREVAVFHRGVRSVDLDTGQVRATADATFELAYAAVASPDGELVATRAAEAWVRVFRRSTREQVHRIHSSGSCAAAFLPDGRLLVGADAEGRLSVLDLAAGNLTPVQQLDGGPGTEQLAVSPDGRLVAGAWSRGRDTAGLRVWHLPSGALRWEHSWRGEALRRLQFTPDGGMLLAVVQFGGEALGWETASWLAQGT